METPERIFFVGNNPSGGKMRVHFEGKDLPSVIKVKGTNDSAPVKLRRNNKGLVTAAWTSKNKYATRTQTLQFIQCGVVVSEKKYDSCGDVILEHVEVSINASKSSITTANGTVKYVWVSDKEEGVDQYTSDKKITGTTSWEDFDADEPSGAGSTYESYDVPTTSASIDYRLRALFLDGTEKVLLTQTLNVVVPPLPHATIKDFAVKYNPDSGFTDISWTSIEEVSIRGYSIKYTSSASPTPIEALFVDQSGSGKTYNFPSVTPEEPGNYTYTIYAALSNGTEQELAHTLAAINVAV